MWTIEKISRLRKLKESGGPGGKRGRVIDALNTFPQHTRDEVVEAWHALVLRTDEEACVRANRLIIAQTERSLGRVAWTFPQDLGI